MKLLFLSGRARLLSIKFLALLLSVTLGPYLVLAGGMPPDVEKDAAVTEKSAEVEVPSPEVEKPSLEVRKETEEVVEEMAEPEKDLPVTKSGFIVGVRGALSILDDDSLSEVSISRRGPLGATVNYDKGYNFSLVLGYMLGNGIRLEAEGGYINNGFQEINVGMPGDFAAQLGLGENKLEGNFSALTLTLNVYYDIDLGSNLVPYVGGGLGGAGLSSKMRSTAGDLLVNNDHNCVFIYQVGTGLGYTFSGYSNGPDITVSLDYRYLASFEDTRFQEEVTTDFIEGEFGGHYIGGGIRLGLW